MPTVWRPFCLEKKEALLALLLPTYIGLSISEELCPPPSADNELEVIERFMLRLEFNFDPNLEFCNAVFMVPS